MVSFEAQYFHELKSNLSSVSPIIQKYKATTQFMISQFSFFTTRIDKDRQFLVVLYTSNIPINSLIYISSVIKILRKEHKIFQYLRISADLADSALRYRGIFGRKVRYITYLKIYIKIRVNTIERDYNGRRVFDLSGKAHFPADSVISAESTWHLIFGT